MHINLHLQPKGLNSLLSARVDLQTTIWCSPYKGERLFSIWAIREVVSYAVLLVEITHKTGSTPVVNAQKGGCKPQHHIFTSVCYDVYPNICAVWGCVFREDAEMEKAWTLFLEVWSRQLKLHKLFPFSPTGVAPAFVVQNVVRNR